MACCLIVSNQDWPGISAGFWRVASASRSTAEPKTITFIGDDGNSVGWSWGWMPVKKITFVNEIPSILLRTLAKSKRPANLRRFWTPKPFI